jgi:nucleotidyltransferase substrate binding protein (TIGR01987 family)
MAQNPDVRWRQRFGNFKQALAQLLGAAELARVRPLSKLEQLGLIKAFEFTHELAWNTLKDFLDQRGHTARIYGSRDATREAFAADLIDDGGIWMKMLESRNATTHTYDEATADSIAQDILTQYVAQFEKLRDTLNEIGEQEDQ